MTLTKNRQAARACTPIVQGIVVVLAATSELRKCMLKSGQRRNMVALLSCENDSERILNCLSARMTLTIGASGATSTITTIAPSSGQDSTQVVQEAPSTVTPPNERTHR